MLKGVREEALHQKVPTADEGISVQVLVKKPPQEVTREAMELFGLSADSMYEEGRDVTSARRCKMQQKER